MHRTRPKILASNGIRQKATTVAGLSDTYLREVGGISYLKAHEKMKIVLIIVLIVVAAIIVLSAVLDAIAHIPPHRPDRRHRRERRSGRTIGQHIKSVERSMDVTNDPAARKALRARMDHLQERVRKFIPRKKTDRRHSHGAA